MMTDTLTPAEVKHTEYAIEQLSDVFWAEPLLNKIRDAGGVQAKNKPLLFEVRFAFELHRRGIVADYEYATGVGNSSVDFRIPGDVEWLIEIVSIQKSDAIKRATFDNGFFFGASLSSTALDPAQSEEAEMITVEQKICEKVYKGGVVTKFPPPSGAIHVIVTDIRGYLNVAIGLAGGDKDDWRQMASGTARVPEPLVQYWDGKPIKGLFEKSNPLKGARFVRERIHFLGFVRESDYREGEIPNASLYFGNPQLFSNEEEGRQRFASYPLRPQ
ncbi:MAG: hypothetical protein HY313_01300 [Acidobacteria bacterium]|nr:hypothetical protein [Acidobacteriota bacterium]